MINIEEVEDVYYKHGEVTDINFAIKSYAAIDIFYPDTKCVEKKLIMSGDLCSLLVVHYDNQFKEHFEIIRGRITGVTHKSIRTSSLFKPKSNDIVVSIDCSTEYNNDIRQITADHILDKFEIDHEFEIINSIPLRKVIDKEEYKVKDDGNIEVDLTNTTIKEDK